MQTTLSRTLTAFGGTHRIVTGKLVEVARKVKIYLGDHRNATIVIFDDLTGQQVELDLRGSEEAVLKRLRESTGTAAAKEIKKTGPGRPKLGVVFREIGLLPRHWEWLGRQPGGASVTLRKLVEEAKKKNVARDDARRAQDAAYRFMSVMAGDLPLFEEALRAFYARDAAKFKLLVAAWPKDVREHALKLSESSLTV